MSVKEVIRRFLGVLEQANIPYMLTGSFASSFHGAPRSTQDVDLVIAPTADQIRALASALPPPEFYFDVEAALDAQRRRGQFNVIEYSSGLKIDLIIRRSRPFSLGEFARRRIVDLLGTKVAIATPEDIVISKLEWAKLGGSERQIEDAAGILRIRSGELDLAYLIEWVESLELSAQWDEARRRSGIAPGLT